MDAITHHLSEGKRVFLALPDGIGKCDFNDLLKQGGIDAVRKSLDNMVEIRDPSLLKNESLLSYTKAISLANLNNRSVETSSKHFDNSSTSKQEMARAERIKDMER